MMYYVKESIEKLNTIVSVSSSASRPVKPISNPCMVLGTESLPHTAPTKACSPLTRCHCFHWFLISCYLKTEFIQSLEKQPPWQGFLYPHFGSENKDFPAADKSRENGTSNGHGTVKEASMVKGASAGAHTRNCIALSKGFPSQWFGTTYAVHMSLSNLFLANEISEKQIRLLLTLDLTQSLLCHSHFLKWSYNSAVKTTWCDRLGRWNGLLMSVCGNGRWAELLKSNKLYRFRSQNNFSYITLMSFLMETNCFVLCNEVPVGAGKFKTTQGHCWDPHPVQGKHDGMKNKEGNKNSISNT